MPEGVNANHLVGEWVDPYSKSSYWPTGRPIDQWVDCFAYRLTRWPAGKFGVWVRTYIGIQEKTKQASLSRRYSSDAYELARTKICMNGQGSVCC